MYTVLYTFLNVYQASEVIT